MIDLPWLDERKPNETFPPVDLALDEPDGLLCAGGCLSPERILNAYQQGIFPWYSDDEPILWWSPNPRLVLKPKNINISRSLDKTIRNKPWRVTINKDFSAVMHACAEPRDNQPGTWITTDMIAAYCELNRLGHAVSVEVWRGCDLVGGLYGIALGAVFFGESMFSRVTDASKVGFALFCQHLESHGFKLIDCQVYSRHLARLGAEQMSRDKFCKKLQRHTAAPLNHNWPTELYNNG